MDQKLLFFLLIEQKVIYFSSQRLKLSKKPIQTLNVTFQLTELKMKHGLDSLDLSMKKNSKKLCQLIPKVFFLPHVDPLQW